MPTASTISRDPALEAHVFWFAHRREILIGLGVVVFALLVYGGYWVYSDRRDTAAAALLATAHDATGYQQVIARYENTGAGATAYLLLSDAQRKAGKYADSNATLQKFLEKHPKHELAPIARKTIAVNLESLGRTDEALAAYQRVAADYPKSYEAPAALIAQVNIYKIKGQNDAARRACETILSQYRGSIWASEAIQQLRQLKPPTSAGSGPGMPGAPTLGTRQTGPPPMLARPPSAPEPSAAAPSAPPAPNAKPSPGKP